jgi:hypothetical protein
MPKSLAQRLAHAEDLAKIFEDYEPREEDRLDIEPRNRLLRAVQERGRAEGEISDAVFAMRSAKWPWADIGSLLGTSGQAAQQRYGKRIS